MLESKFLRSGWGTGGKGEPRGRGVQGIRGWELVQGGGFGVVFVILLLQYGPIATAIETQVGIVYFLYLCIAVISRLCLCIYSALLY